MLMQAAHRADPALVHRLNFCAMLYVVAERMM